MAETGSSSSPQGGSARSSLIVAIAAVLLVAAAVAYWTLRRGPEPPAVPPPPPTSAAPLPPATAPPVTAPPTTLATPRPPPTTAAPSLVDRADAALAAGQAAAALKLYEQALRKNASDGRATAGRQAALGFAKSFVPGKTQIEGGAVPPGFLPPDAESRDMKVARASGSPAKLEFEVAPPHVRPGDAFTVRVSLRNVSAGSLRATTMKLVTRNNGARDERSVSVPKDPIPRGGSVLLAELPWTWGDGVREWSLEVRVSSDSKEVFRSELVWQ